jgi:hypothetical protein
MHATVVAVTPSSDLTIAPADEEGGTSICAKSADALPTSRTTAIAIRMHHRQANADRASRTVAEIIDDPVQHRRCQW